MSTDRGFAFSCKYRAPEHPNQVLRREFEAQGRRRLDIASFRNCDVAHHVLPRAPRAQDEITYRGTYIMVV